MATCLASTSCVAFDLGPIGCVLHTNGDDLTTVAKIFRVSFGNDVDFIQQMTGLISYRILVAERRSRFFSKLHQSSLFQTLLPLFFDRMFQLYLCFYFCVFLCISVYLVFRPAMCHSVFFVIFVCIVCLHLAK